jgi:hypothetical protein
MSNKILNAQEFLEREIALKYPEGKGLHIASILIEFARLHVKAALEAAAENSKVRVVRIEQDQAIWGVEKKSILNCYPHENIQ